MIILIYFGAIIFIAFATWILPLPGKIILMIINFFIPEGLPFIDEIIQFMGIIRHFSKK